MTHKVFTLLSGGLDSSTTLAIARGDFPNDDIECISVDYGQRHRREMECAKAVAAYYGAAHSVMHLGGLLTGMLVDKPENEEIPNVSYGDLPVGISPTYVSFRNGTMLSLLAARAQSYVMAEGDGAEATLYCGVHADDGVNWAYPDCTPEFIGAMSNAVYIGTYGRVRLRAPLQYMNKTQVVERGLQLDVPFQNTWSCYKGEELHCGICPTCRSRREAFDNLGVPLKDVAYANPLPQAA